MISILFLTLVERNLKGKVYTMVCYWHMPTYLLHKALNSDNLSIYLVTWVNLNTKSSVTEKADDFSMQISIVFKLKKLMAPKSYSVKLSLS